MLRKGVGVYDGVGAASVASYSEAVRMTLPHRPPAHTAHRRRQEFNDRFGIGGAGRPRSATTAGGGGAPRRASGQAPSAPLLPPPCLIPRAGSACDGDAA